MNLAAEEITDESPLDIGRVEIPWQATDALESWDRTLANLEDRGVMALQFTRAATEILRLAEPLSTPEAWQQIVDDVLGMGQRHGLSDAVLQGLMAAAVVAPTDGQIGQVVPFGDGPEAYGLPIDGEPDRAPVPPVPLRLICPPAWRDVPLEPMRWLATNRIPAGDVTILSGDGGGGKLSPAGRSLQGKRSAILPIMRQRDGQITLRVAGELRATLEAEAAVRGRSLSKLIRSILTEWAVDRIVERERASTRAA
jgi:hypothetical protein